MIKVIYIKGPENILKLNGVYNVKPSDVNVMPGVVDIYNDENLFLGTFDKNKFTPLAKWREAKGVILNYTFYGEFIYNNKQYIAAFPLTGCEVGDHDVVPILGYENSIIGEECRQCGIKL